MPSLCSIVTYLQIRQRSIQVPKLDPGLQRLYCRCPTCCTGLVSGGMVPVHTTTGTLDYHDPASVQDTKRL
jgi:hypothetical protein